MARIEIFTLRVNPDERRMIAALSRKLERSQSDAVRLLIREAAQKWEVQSSDWRDTREGVHHATT